MAVLSYLEAAGYTVNDKIVISAPKGAKMSYSIIMTDREDSPLYEMVSQTSSLFRDIGMNLRIVPVNSERQYKNKLSSGRHQLWIGQYDTNKEDSLYVKYLNRNDIFGLVKSNIGGLLRRTEKPIKDNRLKKLYKRSYQKIFNMAVEVPVYEQQTAMMYSSARIDIDTMTKDVTGYYSWINEIESIQMK